MRIAASLLASLLLHAVAFLVAWPAWDGHRIGVVFREHLLEPSRYRARESRRVTPQRPASELEYVPSDRAVPAVPWFSGMGYTPLPDSQAVAPPEPATYEVGTRPREGFAVSRVAVEEPSATGVGPTAPARLPLPGLVRLEDVARAGHVRAALVEDSTAKRGLRGFVHLSDLRMNGVHDTTLAVARLARYVSHVTDVDAEMRGGYGWSFEQRQLQRTPVVFAFPGEWGSLHVDMAPAEIEGLGTYLRNGGFLYAEAALDSRPSEIFLEPLLDCLRQALAPDGRLVVVPADHQLYHSFFDFPTGFTGEAAHATDLGDSVQWVYQPRVAGSPGARLWGMELDGHLVAVLSELGLHSSWAATGTDILAQQELAGEGLRPSDPARALDAGVNIVVYAMTRPGGLTQRLAAPMGPMTPATAR